MELRVTGNQRNILAKLGIGCVVCLLLGFGILLHAQEKTKVDFIGTKSEMNSAKMQDMAKMKEQAETQRRFRQRQNRVAIDFGENAAFYKVIIDNNLFRPLGWTPPNNEPAYSLVGTAVDADGVIAQATLLEKRLNRYHFVTIGEKLGDITVKDIQAKQVVLEKDGKPITLKTETLQFLTTNRGSGSKGGEGSQSASEKDGNDAAKNQANARQRQMEAEKRRQMEMKKQIEMLGISQKELAEKLRDSSPAERQEIMREIRRRAAGNRRAGNRGRANRNR
ncbi:MAG: hypothetical protein OXU36_07665 [Candidatus Poribacteria bacterium]|nr:hypothetical protein [Candidatus Poribacteria bacterium]